METRLAVLGRGDHLPGRPLNVPVVPASSFRAGPDGTAGREYARDDGTPGWDAFEELMGDLEGGTAVSFASGMAAICAVLELLPVGARVVVPRDSYTGLRALLHDGAAAGGRWDVQVLDTAGAPDLLDAVAAADLVWLESPSNPMLDLVDLAAVCAAARAAGTVVAVDNTFATPLLQSPLALGADFAVHSATKYVGGHSDLLMGVVVCRTHGRPRPPGAPSRGRRRHAGRARDLPGPARGPHPRPAAAPGAAERGRARRPARRPPGGGRVRYPGLPARPAPRPRRPPDARGRRGRLLRARRRPHGRRRPGPPAGGGARHQRRGRRVDDRATREAAGPGARAARVCCASASAASTSRTCGTTSTPRCARPDRGRAHRR